MQSGIYAILNITNDKIYIGNSSNIKSRWFQHNSLLKRNCHYNKHLQSSFNKHWDIIFLFVVLEIIEKPTKEILIKREQYWIDILKPQYNNRKIAESNLGFKHTEQAKAKMSESRKNPSEEVRKKLSNIRKGSKHSEETKIKMSESRKGRKLSENWKAKIAASRIGKKTGKQSPEHIAKRLEKLKIRDKEKWPCPDGCYCKCNNCKEKRNKLQNIYRKNKSVKGKNYPEILGVEF